VPDVMYCTCRPDPKTGYTKLGDDWVCASCDKPTKMYAEKVILPRILDGYAREGNK